MSQGPDLVALYQKAAKEVCNRSLPDLTLDTELSDLDMTSVEVLEVIGSIEQELNVRFGDEELSKLVKLGDLGQLIESARKKAAARE